MKRKHRTPQEIGKDIAANVDALQARDVTREEFSARNRALWDEAARGEPCIVGSACDKRCTEVSMYLMGRASE